MSLLSNQIKDCYPTTYTHTHTHTHIYIYIYIVHVTPTLKEWKSYFRKSLKELVTISWLCIDHTKLTSFFILKQKKKNNHSVVKAYQTSNAVKHFLIECGDLALIWQRCFNANNMKAQIKCWHGWYFVFLQRNKINPKMINVSIINSIQWILKYCENEILLIKKTSIAIWTTVFMNFKSWRRL